MSSLKAWKIVGIILVLYSIIAGLLGNVPRLPVLNETIRNLYFHVTMWFAMIILLSISLFYSIKHLLYNPNEADKNLSILSSEWENNRFDSLASSSAHVAMMFGLIGLVTGMLWAQFTWGSFWVNDPKLNGTAVTLMVYSAYFILRSSFKDETAGNRISSIYNIFAYVLMIVFIGILPRLTDSLHPGNGGNPGFGSYDLDASMRWVFYPAIIGWALMGWWLVTLKRRIDRIEFIRRNELD
jgi:heme exporter protein C